MARASARIADAENLLALLVMLAMLVMLAIGIPLYIALAQRIA